MLQLSDVVNVNVLHPSRLLNLNFNQIFFYAHMSVSIVDLCSA